MPSYKDLEAGSTISCIPKLLVWSAADQQGIGRLMDVYQGHFDKPRRQWGTKEAYLDDLAFTLDSHRSFLPWRSFMVAQSIANLDLKSSISRPVRAQAPPPRLGFVFTGQGAQWHAMGRDLLSYATFKSSLDTADCYIKQLGCRWSVISTFD